MKNKEIKALQKQLNPLLDQVSKYNKAIDALRDLCEHNMKYTGHGHNKSYYECDICGEETSE